MKRQRGFDTHRLRRLLPGGLKRRGPGPEAGPHFEVVPTTRPHPCPAPHGDGRGRLVAMLERWARLNATLPEELIRHGLASLQIGREALGEAVRFDDIGCLTTRIYACQHFEVLATCWKSGQASPIFDNGDSTCGLLVVEGTATETLFEESPSGKLYPARSHAIPQGTVGLSRKNDVQLIANLQPPGAELVGLQVYSPPLARGRCRRLSETIFDRHDEALDRRAAVRTALIGS